MYINERNRCKKDREYILGTSSEINDLYLFVVPIYIAL